MYTTWCLTLYHNPIYYWAPSIYNYFNLIPMPLYHSHTLLSNNFLYCHNGHYFRIENILTSYEKVYNINIIVTIQ